MRKCLNNIFYLSYSRSLSFLDRAHDCIQAAEGEDAFSVFFPTDIDEVLEPQPN